MDDLHARLVAMEAAEMVASGMVPGFDDIVMSLADQHAARTEAGWTSSSPT